MTDDKLYSNPHSSTYKRKNRKARYTFPNELDDVYDKPTRHKHRRKTHCYSVTDYNSNGTVHITEYNDGVCQKIVIQKYNKTHPEEEYKEPDESAKISIHKTPAVGCLSAVVLKILCVLGIISISI